MTNKHREACSILLVISKMPVKATMAHGCTSSGMAKKKKIDNSRCNQWCGTSWGTLLAGCKLVPKLCKIAGQCLLKQNVFACPMT